MKEGQTTPDYLSSPQIELELTDADIRSASLKGIGLDSIALLLGDKKRFLQVYLWPFIAFGYVSVQDRLREYTLLQEDFSRHISNSPLCNFVDKGVCVSTEVIPKGIGVPVDFSSLDDGILEEWVKISEFPAIKLFQLLVRTASHKCQLPGLITSHIVHAPNQKDYREAWERSRFVSNDLSDTITKNEQMLTMLDVTERLDNEVTVFAEHNKSHPFRIQLAADNIHYDWSPSGKSVRAIITDIGSQVFPDAAERIDGLAANQGVLARHCKSLFGIDFV